MLISRPIIALLLCLALSACSVINDTAAFNQNIAARVISNSVLCGPNANTAGVRWLDSASDLQQQLQAMDGAELENNIDFARERVLFLSMGKQATTGYRLNLLPQDGVRFNGATLRVNVSWQQPDADSIEAQVITQPCLLIALEKIDFQHIQVIDQHDQVRIQQAR